jgi:hypothetical protein
MLLKELRLWLGLKSNRLEFHRLKISLELLLSPYKKLLTHAQRKFFHFSKKLPKKYLKDIVLRMLYKEP